MYNHGPWNLQLIPGKDLVCQVIFYKLTSPVSQKVINAFGTYKKQSTPFPALTMRLVSDWGVETSSREIDKVLYGRPTPKRTKSLKRSERDSLPKLKPFVREKHDRFD